MRIRKISNLLSVITTNENKTTVRLEFLPAAEEIIETPANPLGRAIIWSIALFFMLALFWASVSDVDIVAIGEGKIISSGKIKIIQPINTSIVKSIHVEEGQQVEKGQLLIELDSTEQSADISKLLSEQQAAEQDNIRLTELLNRLASNEKKDKSTNSEILSARIAAEYRHYQSQLESTGHEIKQKLAEQEVIKIRVSQLKTTIPLITERADAYKELLVKNSVARHQWLQVEQERIEQVKDLEAQLNYAEQIKSAIKSSQQKLISVKQQIMADLLKQREEAITKISITKQEVIKAKQRNTLQQLISPITGVVQQLAVHTIGGVVTPAQELMRIVPINETLEVEAFFQNKDIGFVKEGQQAEIKIAAFPFTKYGTIDAKIRMLSNDAVTDEKLGLVYTARVTMKKFTIEVEDKLMNLTPGMAVSVEAKTGSRKMIEFLMSPLLKYKNESIRER